MDAAYAPYRAALFQDQRAVPAQAEQAIIQARSSLAVIAATLQPVGAVALCAGQPCPRP